MAEVSRKIDRLAPTLLSVILLGETGTGKEVVARELHRRSARSQGPFVAINCAAIPAALLESTLFGHEKGAFTGAVRSHAGRFLQADGGTLFLDEIGDLPIELQAKLLRALQEKTVEPIGGSKPVPIDVRVIAATHQDLDAAIKAGRFRGDLYFRLSGAILKLPPLRERTVDILPLAEHFIRSSGARATLSEDASRTLKLHTWPGNIRELEQAITRASLLCSGGVIKAEDLELQASAGGPSGASAAGALALKLEDAQSAFTQDFVRQALLQRGGNRSETAAALGISERTLYRILADTKPEADPPGRPV
jgi:DNA-binding NtrC family response regulator